MNQSPTPKSPPKWAIRFLEWFCPRELFEGILGDLWEEYELHLTEYSVRKANLYFFWNTLRFFHPSIILRNHRTVKFINMGILKNYVKVAFRSFGRQKLITSINVFGLTLGIACASLAFIFVQHELSYDKFHQDHENIFWLTGHGYGGNFPVCPGPLAPGAAENIPEVTQGLRILRKDVQVIDDTQFFEESALYVDPNFFTFFDFELLQQKDQHPFDHPNSIVISKKMALKYFGSKDPLGQRLQLRLGENIDDFLVSGVSQDPPKNSTIQYAFLLPIRSAFKDAIEKLDSDWRRCHLTTLVRLNEPKDLKKVEEKLNTYVKSQFESANGEPAKFTFSFKPFTTYHLDEKFAVNGFANQIENSYVKTLSIIGLLILIVACLNFMNLSNAKSVKRLTEVGVRKVLGARALQLRNQFLLESILISFFALFLAILLAEYALPFISEITGYELVIDWLSLSVVLPLIGITLLTGILAGIYPAWLLSKLDAAKTFKANLKMGGNNWTTKGSLIFQFALSVGLMSCTLIMYQQQKFIGQYNLGFKEDAVIVIPTQIRSDKSLDGDRLVTQFKQTASQISGVETISSVSYSFNRGNAAQIVQEKEGEPYKFVFEYRVDENYVPMLDIELKNGQNFAADGGDNATKKVIINEAFLKEFKIDDYVGYRLPESFNSFADYEIIGVAKDYHYSNLREKVKPMILHQSKNPSFGYILVKAKPDQLDGTLAQLEKAWSTLREDKPFEFSFMEDDIQRQYESEARWNKVISGATLLAILISTLGLFGLIALTLAEKTKEIGVRKILGASIFDITWMVSKQFILLLILATLIAVPLAVYGMQLWLDNFAYQINIPWYLFMVAVVFTAGLAFFTTAIQSIKAALQNPVDALRSE